eukprot:TRINITY_DN4274_c0_g1_i1.p2 TRINITY_DN4274_c0_g1~~TRINITY_DN4274_c0_g1_i1.p2  ORF type:complete len:83 (-),score=13.36 TRINITY_DN4274_c0_g1_i1:30-278(-)
MKFLANQEFRDLESQLNHVQLIDKSNVLVQLGAPLGIGEIKIKVFLYDLENLEQPLKDLFEFETNQYQRARGLRPGLYKKTK